MKISKYNIKLTNVYYFYLLVFIFKSTLKNFRWVGLEMGIVNYTPHRGTYVANIKEITFCNTHILIYTKTDDYFSDCSDMCRHTFC